MPENIVQQKAQISYILSKQIQKVSFSTVITVELNK